MSDNGKTAGNGKKGNVYSLRAKWLSRLYREGAGPAEYKPPVQAPSSGEQKKNKSATPVRITSPYIIKFTAQDGHLAEEYRKLKSSILAVLLKNEKQNMFMITSSESGEGKSITAINLALVLAQESNRTVLLVDADLRRPSLHTYLGLKPEVGLADCIVDGVDLHDALIKTSVPRLNFLPAGKKSDTPAELLSSDAMKAIVWDIKNRYHDRIILFDTPPALIFSDIRILSMFADGIIFIVKEGVAAHNVRESLAALKESPIMGIVYNAVSQEQLRDRYHRYYHYYGRK
jgi:protein-tyrosine kinase